MTTISTANAPYYDDFNQSKGFTKILFKPGYSVQARELTQLQSIIQYQLGSFGSNVFTQGSVVIPGGCKANLSVPYITIQSTATPLSFYQGQILVSTSGVLATVIETIAATASDPITLYVTYISGGSNGASTFIAGETLTVQGQPTTPSVTLNTTNATGFGSFAYVNDGVYFVNNTFAQVNKQSVCISKYTSNPSALVLLQINETIITSYEDSTLLDPAQGSYNYAAPGADRYSIVLTLTTLPYGTTLTSDYVLLMSYNNGTLEEQILFPSYNMIEKELARRTYDESGNFVQSGYSTVVRESLLSGANNGVSPTGNINSVVYQVSGGNAYLQGFQKLKNSTTYLTADKGRTADHIKEKDNITLGTNYGQSIFITQPLGSPTWNTLETVQIWNVDATTGGTQIGTAKVLFADYLAGDPTQNTQVIQLYVADLSINPGYSLESAGSIRYTGGSAVIAQKCSITPLTGTLTLGETVNNSGATKAGTVRYVGGNVIYISKSNALEFAPQINDIITGATSGATATIISKSYATSGAITAALMPIPYAATFSATNSLNNPANTFTVWETLTIVPSGSTFTGSASVSSGYINSPLPDQMIAFNSNGILNLSLFSVSGGNTLIFTGGSSYTGGNVTVLVSVTLNNSAYKTKTLVTTSISVPAASTISLGQSDIYSLNSVTASTGDVTTLFTLDNGQRDYYYGLGSISTTSTLSGTLTINFSYFTHSPSGAFFSADSYSSLGTGYIGLIPGYTSPTSGAAYSLENCLDFRQTVASDGTFTSSGAILTPFPVPNSMLSTSIQYYVPRIDIVGISQSGSVTYLRGTPADNPVSPLYGSNFFPLYVVNIPPYTYSIKDVSLNDVRIMGYTMKDIGSIDNRVTDLENYAAVTSAEKSLLSTNITNTTTGITRFKTGYISETFTDPSTTSIDFFDPEYSATMNDNGSVVPPMSILPLPLTLLTSSTSFQNTGGLITLPYTHQVFTQQNLSSAVTNVNPFASVSWQGVMTITPAQDNFNSTQTLPGISQTNTVTNYVTAPSNYGSTSPVGGFGFVVGPEPANYVPPYVPTIPVINNVTGQTVWMAKPTTWAQTVSNHLAASGI